MALGVTQSYSRERNKEKVGGKRVDGPGKEQRK